MREGSSRDVETARVEMLDFRCDYGYCNFKYPRGYRGSNDRFLRCPNAELVENEPLKIKCRKLEELCPPLHGV